MIFVAWKSANLVKNNPGILLTHWILKDSSPRHLDVLGGTLVSCRTPGCLQLGYQVPVLVGS